MTSRNNFASKDRRFFATNINPFENRLDKVVNSNGRFAKILKTLVAFLLYKIDRERRCFKRS